MPGPELSALVSEWQKAHQMTPQELLQQNAKEQNLLRAAAKARNPEAFNQTRQTSAAYVRKNFRGYDARRGGLSEVQLQRKQAFERPDHTPMPFSKNASSLLQSMGEREIGYRPLPETKPGR